MNAWPTLREWFQFGGTLALELAVVFAVAKLVALRLRPAQGRRALWQIAILAMLLVTADELNGVRGWMRWPEKKTSPAAQAKLVVAFKDVEPDFDLFRDADVAEAPASMGSSQPAPRPSRWQQHAVWPALIWAAGLALVLVRMVFAQVLVISIRLSGPRLTAAAVMECSQRLAQALGIRRNVLLLTSGRTVAPFTFGVGRPVIVLPRSFATTFTPEQQDAALAHELAHVAGFDWAWRCFSQFACAVLWWFPLVWLARRELDHASELVADEASLLVANGPDRLAECLLACAKELRRPAYVGWLGMDGGGFRSALGQRVARLLELPPHTRLSRPVPWYFRLLAPVVGVALLWMGMAAVLKSSEPRGAWRTSILGSAFAATVEIKPQAQVAETNRADVAQLAPGEPAAVGADRDTNGAGPRFTSVKRQVLIEKLRRIRLSEWGPLDNLPLSEVIRGLNDAAVRLDPEHTGVHFIISPNVVPEVAGIDASGRPVAQTNEPVDLNGIVIRLGTVLKDTALEDALYIVTKLADGKIKYSVEDFGVIISPKGEEPEPMQTRFYHLDSDMIQFLIIQATNSLEHNPPDATERGRGGRETDALGGIRFLTEVTPTQSNIPLLRNLFRDAGVDLAVPGKSIFLNDRLELLMVRATLVDLDAIEKTFPMLKPAQGTNGLPLNFRPSIAHTNASAAPLLNNLVKPATNPDQPTNLPALHTRIFNVDSNTLRQGIGALARSTGMLRGGGEVKRLPPTRLATELSPTNMISTLNSLFIAAGAALEQPGTTMYYADRRGSLMVRATLGDLEIVEKILHSLIQSHRQLQIEVKVVEVPVNRSDCLYLGSTFLTNNGASPSSTNRRLGESSSQDFLREGLRGTVTNGLLTAIPPQETFTNSGQPTIQGILTPEHYQLIIGAMEKTGGASLLSNQIATMLSGHQAQLKVVDIRYIVTELDYGTNTPTRSTASSGTNAVTVGTGGPAGPIPIAEPFEIGPVVDVVPYALADGQTINLTATGTRREFLGYRDPETNGVPLPKFRVRQATANVQMLDGQTLVLGAGTARDVRIQRNKVPVLGDLPYVGRFFRSESSTTTSNALFFFITPRLIDLAGNPVHSDEEVRLKQTN